MDQLKGKTCTRIKDCGRRKEDSQRTSQQMNEILSTIPVSARRSSETINSFTNGKHWSHFHAHSRGGSNDAYNGIFEHGPTNLSRSSADVTPNDYVKIVERNVNESRGHPNRHPPPPERQARGGRRQNSQFCSNSSNHDPQWGTRLRHYQSPFG